MKTLVCKSFFPRVSSSFGSEARFHSRSIHSFGMRCAAPRALYSTNSFKRPLIHIVHLNALIELKENRVVRSALLSPTFNWYKKKYRFHLRERREPNGISFDSHQPLKQLSLWSFELVYRQGSPP